MNDSENMDIKTRPTIEVLFKHVVPRVAAHWSDVGLALGLDCEIIKNITKMNHQQDTMKCKAMFNKWLETSASVNWGLLIQALRCAEFEDVAEDIQLLLQVNKVRECGASDDIATMLKMRRLYKTFQLPNKLYKTVALVKGVETTECTTLYRDTAERKDCKILGDLEKIFQFSHNNDPPRCILIEGNPGIGKTVLCKEIAFRWSRSELLTSCKLLLVLFLRDPNVQKISTVQELAKYVTVSNDEANVLCSYLENKGIVMIILDGFDEMDSKLRKSSFFTKLIKRQYLPKATIVVTSRPFASACLHNAADVKVDIIGFHQSSTKQYAAEALKKFPSKLEKLQKYFKQHPNIDASCFIPSVMSIIIHLCLHLPEDLPPTLSKIYEKFTILTICEYLKSQQIIPEDTVINELEQFPQPVFQGVQQLAKFAFKSLVADKILSAAEEISDMCKDNSTCYGLLQSGTTKFIHSAIQEFLAAKYMASLHDYEIHKHLKESLFKMEHFHKQFSEVWTLYCSLTGEKGLKHNLRLAMHSLPIHDYVLHLNKFQSSADFQPGSAPTTFDPGTIPPALSSTILQPDGLRDGSLITSLMTLSPDIWCFILGNQKTSTTSGTQLKAAFQEQISEENIFLQKALDDPIKIFYSFKCSQEAQDETLCEVLSKPFSTNKISLENYKLLAQHAEYLGLFLTSKAKWTELNFYNCQIGDKGVILLHRYLCRETDKKQEILMIDFMWNNLSEVSLPFIIDIIVCCHLHTVKLGCNDFPRVRDITAVLKNNNTLKVLNLWGCGISAQEAAAISDMVTTLEELNVSTNNLSDDGAILLSEGLSRSTTLRVLYINDNNIGPQGVVAIAQALLRNKTLLALNITNNVLGQEGATAFASAIMKNETLEELFLYGKKTLTEPSAIILLEKLYNSNNTIIKLGLYKEFANNNCINNHIENINIRRKWSNKQDIKFQFY